MESAAGYAGRACFHIPRGYYWILLDVIEIEIDCEYKRHKYLMNRIAPTLWG